MRFARLRVTRKEIVHVEKIKKFHVGTEDDESMDTDIISVSIIPRKRGRPRKTEGLKSHSLRDSTEPLDAMLLPGKQSRSCKDVNSPRSSSITSKVVLMEKDVVDFNLPEVKRKRHLRLRRCTGQVQRSTNCGWIQTKTRY